MYIEPIDQGNAWQIKDVDITNLTTEDYAQIREWLMTKLILVFKNQPKDTYAYGKLIHNIGYGKTGVASEGSISNQESCFWNGDAERLVEFYKPDPNGGQGSLGKMSEWFNEALDLFNWTIMWLRDIVENIIDFIVDPIIFFLVFVFFLVVFVVVVDLLEMWWKRMAATRFYWGFITLPLFLASALGAVVLVGAFPLYMDWLNDELPAVIIGVIAFAIAFYINYHKNPLQNIWNKIS